MDDNNGISLAVPVLRDVDKAYSKVKSLRAGGFLGPILVSINSWDGYLGARETSRRFELLGCKVYLHTDDKGLYGNFKFLLDKIETSHFMWVALDDSPPSKLWTSKWRPGSSTDLVIGNMNLTEFSKGAFGEVIERIDSSDFFTCDELNIQPGFIFGIWKTEFARKVWPNNAMDWLDTYILLCARIQGIVVQHHDAGPWTIGHTSKSPHRVNGKFHNPIRWFFKVLLLYGFGKPLKVYVSLFRSLAAKAQFSLEELKQYRKNR
jgi:hypothetical protein